MYTSRLGPNSFNTFRLRVFLIFFPSAWLNSISECDVIFVPKFHGFHNKANIATAYVPRCSREKEDDIMTLAGVLSTVV